jgi:crotonobetainyl-CoA:carnitine CoA-transferase CaiB-like acyl-CoA transferase
MAVCQFVDGTKQSRQEAFAIDLKDAEGRELLLELLETATSG